MNFIVSIASNNSSCRDSYPINDTESCPKCDQLKNEGKCDMKWKKALRGNENKRCRKRFNSNQLKDTVDQWCQMSCGSCSIQHFISFTLYLHAYFCGPN